MKKLKSLYIKTKKLTKKYKPLCGLQAIFRRKRCQRPEQMETIKKEMQAGTVVSVFFCIAGKFIF